jgi:signal transduction histidine kinase
MLVGIVRDISEYRRLEKLKDEMLAGISHEMVTPLTAVVGFLELLLEDDLAPQQREYLQTCLREENRLQALIENLLAMQRLRSGETLRVQTVAICSLLTEAAAAFTSVHCDQRNRAGRIAGGWWGRVVGQGSGAGCPPGAAGAHLRPVFPA